MKIISYNISTYSQAKIDHILDMGADLYVLPECANKDYVQLPDEYDMLWTGDDDVPQKGLAVIWKKHLNVGVIQDHKKIKHHLPIIAYGDGLPMFILACWPTIWKEKKTYPQLLLEMLQEYKDRFKMFPSLVIGDFNCYIGQSGITKKTGTFEDCISVLLQHNMTSAYHEFSGEEFGKESEATFYWRFKEDSPFFLDYAFTSKVPARFEVGKWEKEISDHRPLLIEFAKERNKNRPAEDDNDFCMSNLTWEELKGQFHNILSFLYRLSEDDEEYFSLEEPTKEALYAIIVCHIYRDYEIESDYLPILKRYRKEMLRYTLNELTMKRIMDLVDDFTEEKHLAVAKYFSDLENLPNLN